MKARARFYAMGQSHEARKVPYPTQRPHMSTWPHWAKRAYCAGRMSVPPPGGTKAEFEARVREYVKTATGNGPLNVREAVEAEPVLLVHQSTESAAYWLAPEGRCTHEAGKP